MPCIAGPHSVMCIGQALHWNKRLLSLNLSYNTVKDDGAAVLGLALADNDW